MSFSPLYSHVRLYPELVQQQQDLKRKNSLEKCLDHGNMLHLRKFAKGLLNNTFSRKTLGFSI